MENFSGKLLADCYSGYQQIALRTAGRIERAACVAHARRRVFEARDNYPREASLVLAKFQQLYDIEDRGKPMSPEARLELREKEALPIWDALGAWLASKAALNRKNWLFIGSLAAGDRAADFFTLVYSALRNDLDVWAYVKDVLERLLAGETDYAALRPDVWAQAHPEAIRQYRREERRDKADRKQLRRATRRRASKR